jgi:hypothetical protein
VCIDQPESVEQLMSKIINCLSNTIDFFREITSEELDAAFEGVVDSDDENDN